MAAAPSGYKYTVDAYEINKYGTGQDSVPSIYGVKFTKSKSVMIDSRVIYRITVYKDNIVIPDGGVAISGDGNVQSRVLGSGPFATFKEAVKDFCDVDGIRTIEDKYYDFTLTPKGKKGTASPKFTVEVRINNIWVTVSIASNSSIPSTMFSKKITPPGLPSSVTATDAGLSFGQNPEYEWNSCKREWARRWLHNAQQVNRTPDEVKRGLGPKWEVTITVKYYNELGQFKREDTLNNKRESNYDFTKKGSGWQKAKALLAAAKNCAVPNTAGGTPPGGGGSVTPTPETVKKASNFNPYPHITTRHFAARVWNEMSLKSGDNVYDQLASFYVDPEIVDLPEKDRADLPGGKSAQLNRFWGFRFLFNPQYISYNMSSNNQVDWTRPNENNAALVASGIGGSITVNILLDRVADMTTMREWQKTGGGQLPSGLYPVSMDAEQCAGILHRGTEYDLEYLFRVLNGNPQKVILMGNNPKDGLELLSANMGYITQLPFIFKISERMRYKVILQSISVEHSMFTREMIPIRTVVQIQLERLPDLTSGGFKKFNQAEQLNKIGPLIAASTATTPLSGAEVIARRRATLGEI
jgi:hypothetical protein